MTEQKPRGLGRPVSVVRAELMADEETQTIARTLGMPLEDYVERVLHFAQNPDAEPQLEVVDDEVLQEMDPQLPTMGDMMSWLQKVDSGEISLGPQELITDFDDEESTITRKARQAAGDTSAVAAPRLGSEGKGQIEAGDDEAGRLLKQQLLRETQAARTRATDRTHRRKQKPEDAKG